MLNKYILDDSDKILAFVTANIDNANLLSKELIKTIDFKNGIFFTLFPENSDLERLYEFEAGVILPQNPEIIRYSEDGSANSYSITPTITHELAEVLFNIIKSKNNLFCIFDDVVRNPENEYSKGVIKSYKYLYSREVYYILNSNNVSCENVIHCLNASDALWHSLCILTSAELDMNDNTLTLQMIHQICQHAQLILVGAYDGEGYVFWEKNGSNFFSNSVGSD